MAYKILLGVTGSIAAYKTPDLVRRLRELGHEVRVVLTEGGKALVSALALQAVSGNPVHTELLDSAAEAAMGHIELARWADLILVAPASANCIARLAQGCADDLLTTLCLASEARLVVAPAMNSVMWSKPATQENINTLKHRETLILGPVIGVQACGEVGLGKMMEPLELAEQLQQLHARPCLKSQRILITAGPTQESIDPVRYLSNRSSGKMGYALAQAAIEMGAAVTLISGPVSLKAPENCQFIQVKTADEMFKAVQDFIQDQDIFIGVAAVADYKVAEVAPQKIKKGQAIKTLSLVPTVDILECVGRLNPKPFVVGFSAETHEAESLAEQKRLKKNVDLMVVNDVSQPDIGFESDMNAVTLLSAHEPIVLERASKKQIARQILEFISAEKLLALPELIV